MIDLIDLQERRRIARVLGVTMAEVKRFRRQMLAERVLQCLITRAEEPTREVEMACEVCELVNTARYEEGQ